MPTVNKAEEISDEIFELLKRRGPLCISQISVELLLPPRKVQESLKALKETGLIDLRPDRNETQNNNADLTPWGLARNLGNRRTA
ncbi:MAG: winged helix-turn-helix domain-containing protein [Pyrinomonadaceae bacterium]